MTPTTHLCFTLTGNFEAALPSLAAKKIAARTGDQLCSVWSAGSRNTVVIIL
jgi:hypothetical protein